MAPTARAVALGQLLAALIAVTAASSALLARGAASFPALQSSLNYALLTIVYGALHIKKQKQAPEVEGHVLPRSWYWYALLGFLDVEANVLVILGYRYTSLTSVTLLDCWSIPVALALTRFWGLAAYKRGHYFGASLCITGLAILVATDERWKRDAGVPSPNPVLGDALVVLGASLYACCNVLQERMLKDAQMEEILCMLGISGFLVSALQGGVFELAAALNASWDAALVYAFFTFAAAMFAFYSLVPLQLSWGGAAILNISLLGSDVWTALVRLVFFGGFTFLGGISFLICFAFLSTGITLYTLSGEVKTSTQDEEDVARHERLPRYVRVRDREQHDNAQKRDLETVNPPPAQGSWDAGLNESEGGIRRLELSSSPKVGSLGHSDVNL